MNAQLLPWTVWMHSRQAGSQSKRPRAPLLKFAIRTLPFLAHPSLCSPNLLWKSLERAPQALLLVHQLVSKASVVPRRAGVSDEEVTSYAPLETPPRPGWGAPLPETMTTAVQQSDARNQQGRDLALLAAQAGMDKKALGIEIIDVVGKVDYADYLVLMTGTSDRHCAAIARGVDEELTKSGHKPLSVEGLPQANWVLLDFFDIVVHVFSDDSRSLYDLSGLWIDAARVPLPARMTNPNA